MFFCYSPGRQVVQPTANPQRRREWQGQAAQATLKGLTLLESARSLTASLLRFCLCQGCFKNRQVLHSRNTEVPRYLYTEGPCLRHRSKTSKSGSGSTGVHVREASPSACRGLLCTKDEHAPALPPRAAWCLLQSSACSPADKIRMQSQPKHGASLSQYPKVTCHTASP